MRDRCTTPCAGSSLLTLALAVVAAAGCGAGGAESAPGDRSSAPAASEASSPAGATTAAAPFDYTPKPAIPGFDRHSGKCDSYFRYSFQYPEAWEVEDSTNGAARMRTDDEIWNIQVIGDLFFRSGPKGGRATKPKTIRIGGKELAFTEAEFDRFHYTLRQYGWEEYAIGVTTRRGEVDRFQREIQSILTTLERRRGAKLP